MTLQLFSHSPDVQGAGYANGKADLVVASDGTYLAYPEFSAPYINAFKFGPDGILHKMPNPDVLLDRSARGCGWSPDGSRLVVAGGSGSAMVYTRSGTDLTWEQNLTISGLSNDAAYSPDGQYLVVSSSQTPYVQFFSWDGDTAYAQSADPAALPTGAVKCVAWSRDSTYVAAAHENSPHITIYRNNGDGTFTKVPDPADLPAGNGFGCAFSPNRDMLAVTYWSWAPFIHLYEYNTGTDTFTRRDTHLELPDNGYGVKFGNDMLVVGHDASFDTALATYFEWDGSQFGSAQELGKAPDSFNYTPGVELIDSGSNVFLATDSFEDPLKHFGQVNTTHSLLYDQGPLDSMPSAAVEGRIYKPTNEPGALYCDEGSRWVRIPPPEPPPLAGPAWTEIGTADLGPVTNGAERVTIRQVGQYQFLVLTPHVGNMNTHWELVHADFWSVIVQDSGIWTGFEIRDAIPVGDNKLLAHDGTADSMVLIEVVDTTVTFGNVFNIQPSNNTTGHTYAPAGADKFVQCWGSGANGAQQYARMWSVSGLTASAVSAEQQYADLPTIAGTTAGLNPNLGTHHFGSNIFMPFGSRYTGSWFAGFGLIVNWDGTNFNFVHGPTDWYTSGGFFYGSGGQRNTFMNVYDGGPCAVAYGLYDNVSGYDHGIHRYSLNGTSDGIVANSLKNGIGLHENNQASIALGGTPIVMGENKAGTWSGPRAVNMDPSNWSIYSTHTLPHSNSNTDRYGIGCAASDRIAVGVWGDVATGLRHLRAWHI